MVRYGQVFFVDGANAYRIRDADVQAWPMFSEHCRCMSFLGALGWKSQQFAEGVVFSGPFIRGL